MKISILVVLIGLFIPTILRAHEKRSNNVMTDTLRPVIKNRPVEHDSMLFKQLKPPPQFKIHTLNELKEQLRGVKPVHVIAKPNPGNVDDEKKLIGTNIRPRTSFYKTENGLVLNALKPKHAATGSELRVHNVIYSPGLFDYISNNISVSLYQEFEYQSVEVVGPEGGDQVLQVYPISAIARFYDLPSGNHTYLLTYGTNLSKNRVRINFGAFNSTIFKGDQLIQIPGSNEIRVLFTFTPDSSNDLYIKIEYSPGSWEYKTGHFNHLQLVQLD